MKIDYEANKKWAERSMQAKIAKQNEPRSSPSSSSMPRQRKPIPQRSKKRIEEDKTLARIKRGMIKVDPLCRKCKHNKGTDIHHCRGTAGPLYTDERYLVLLCRPCHDGIEIDPLKAAFEGWKQTRFNMGDEKE